MTFDLMNLGKNEISCDLGSYLNFFYGRSKAGKTTLVSKLGGDKNLIIATEKGYSALNVFAIDLTNWNQTSNLLRELKNPEVKAKFKTVTIDTIDILFNLATEYVLKINGCRDLSDKPFGKLYGEVDKIFNDFLLAIIREGYGMYLIGHAKAQSKLMKQNEKESEIDYIQPSLARRGYQIVANMVDNIFYCTIDYDENGEEIRVLKTRATAEYFAGSRFEHLPDTILMDADSLNEELSKAIKLQGKTTEKKKDLIAKENKIDFEKVMEQLNTLVMDKFVPNDKLNIVNKIVEKHLGIGNKVADATEDQADALQIILDELLMKAEELGL